MHLNVQINVSFYKVCEKVLTNHVFCIFKLKRDILIYGRQNDDIFSEKVDNWSRYTLCHCATPIYFTIKWTFDKKTTTLIYVLHKMVQFLMTCVRKCKERGTV